MDLDFWDCSGRKNKLCLITKEIWYKMDLDFWDCSGRKNKLGLITKEIWYKMDLDFWDCFGTKDSVLYLKKYITVLFSCKTAELHIRWTFENNSEIIFLLKGNM